MSDKDKLGLAPTWSVKMSRGGKPSPETIAALKRHEEILANVGNFRKEPLKATKEFFHMWPFSTITEPSQNRLIGSRGVEIEHGPKVLEEQFKKYFLGR